MEKVLDDLELNIHSKEAILLNVASALEKKIETQAEIDKLEEEVVDLKASIAKIQKVKELEQSIREVSKIKRKREKTDSNKTAKRDSKSKVKIYVDDKFSIPTNPKVIQFFLTISSPLLVLREHDASGTCWTDGRIHASSPRTHLIKTKRP